MEVAWSFCCLLLRRVFQLPAVLCCEAMAWAVTFLAFPLRTLTAVDRERKLVRLVAEMQAQMDDLAWENTALEDALRAALREQQALEAALDEAEDEHEDALAMIHALETQLKALRQENARLNEHRGKSKWDNKPAAKSDKKPAAKREWRGDEDAAAAAKRVDPASALALTSEAAAEEEAVASSADGSSVAMAAAVARRRSVFSVVMTVAVGAVAWSAADAPPCLPLMAGLLAVVAVSMRSVSRLMMRRRSTGSSDASVSAVTALLGLNWFLLGLLTTPMLPAVLPRAGQSLAWLAAAAAPPAFAPVMLRPE